MKITEDSIERVPVLESSILPSEYWDTLRDVQQELLRFVQKDKPGTEAIAYYDMHMKLMTRYKGASGKGRVLPTWYDEPHIVIHNHPTGNTFTFNDFVAFMDNAATELMCVTGNNGTSYTLEKAPGFEAAKAVRTFLEVQTFAADSIENIDSYLKVVENFFQSLSQYGFVYRKG